MYKRINTKQALKHDITIPVFPFNLLQNFRETN
jgi:hypothetical protein